MKKPNSWAAEISRNLPHLKIIEHKPKDKPDTEVEDKPKLKDQILDLTGLCLLTVMFPFIPEYAMLIAEALK